jgi:4-hydroxybenzoyl-CoA thioesterase
MPYRAHLEVQFGDIDQARIVYYPRFIHYFHVAMEQFFRDVIGIDYPQVMNEHRLGHPTVHLEVDFKIPLRYGDVVEIEVSIESVGRTSVVWSYTVFRRGHPEVHATGRVITVNIDLDSFEKREIPDWMRGKLESYRDRWARVGVGAAR